LTSKLLAIALLFTTAAQAGPWHCQRNGVTVHNCHMCMRGHWPTGEEHRCSAAQERRQMRDLEQRQCMIDLTNVPDGKFKRACLKQSEKMP
jgi:hypothetical protein